MAQSLDLDVIAEGVEDEESATLLTRFGCPSQQGYCYSKPLPEELAAAAYDQILSMKRLS